MASRFANRPRNPRARTRNGAFKTEPISDGVLDDGALTAGALARLDFPRPYFAVFPFALVLLARAKMPVLSIWFSHCLTVLVGTSNDVLSTC